MSDEELLLKDYERQIRQAEYYENSARGNVTNYILTISAVVISLTKIGEDGLEQKDLWIAILLIVLGVFGFIFNAKMHERFWHHQNRARELREIINNDYYPHLKPKIKDALDTADNKSREKGGLLNWVRLHVLWMCFSSLISITGFIMSIIILINCSCS